MAVCVECEDGGGGGVSSVCTTNACGDVTLGDCVFEAPCHHDVDTAPGVGQAEDVITGADLAAMVGAGCVGMPASETLSVSAAACCDSRVRVSMYGKHLLTVPPGWHIAQRFTVDGVVVASYSQDRTGAGAAPPQGIGATWPGLSIEWDDPVLVAAGTTRTVTVGHCVEVITAGPDASGFGTVSLTQNISAQMELLHV